MFHWVLNTSLKYNQKAKIYKESQWTYFTYIRPSRKYYVYDAKNSTRLHLAIYVWRIHQCETYISKTLKEAEQFLKIEYVLKNLIL